MPDTNVYQINYFFHFFYLNIFIYTCKTQHNDTSYDLGIDTCALIVILYYIIELIMYHSKQGNKITEVVHI